MIPYLIPEAQATITIKVKRSVKGLETPCVSLRALRSYALTDTHRMCMYKSYARQKITKHGTAIIASGRGHALKMIVHPCARHDNATRMLQMSNKNDSQATTTADNKCQRRTSSQRQIMNAWDCK